MATCDAWTSTLPRPVVSIEADESAFTRRHDAAALPPYAADCVAYVVLREGTALEARHRVRLASLAAQGSPAAQDALGRPLVADGLGGAPCRYGP